MLSDIFNHDFTLKTGLIALLAATLYKWSTWAKHSSVSPYGQWVVFGKPQVVTQFGPLSGDDTITHLLARFC